MHFFSHKKPILPLPDGCTPEQIKSNPAFAPAKPPLVFTMPPKRNYGMQNW